MTCLTGIVWREGLRFLHQRERFVSALVRPLVWLFIFAAGFRQVLGISIIPPYETYILYEVFIAPGLMAMIQLFNGMQSSLSMVYDREMGNMRTLLVSPLPRGFLLFCKLLAGTAVSLLQVYAFLIIAWFWDITPPPIGYLTVLPALILSGLMLGSLGMLISSGIKQLENFAGVMNFVIFPMFFASSALYPLWRVQEGSPYLYYVCQANPFTHAVELIRFALYGQINWISLAVVGACTIVFMIGAIFAYDPSRAGTRGLTRETPRPDPAAVPALSIDGVSHSYGPRRALIDVSFNVQPASFTALLGLNGAGKSTLFSLITRLFGIQTGRVGIFGHDVSRTPGEALRLLGVVFQPRTLDLDLSLTQNLLYHAALHGISRREAAARSAELLARIGLADRAGSKVRDLSGGQMRRLEIARALLHRPRLLLLDEPTVGLDVKARADIISHVRQLVTEQGIGVLWATHLFDEIVAGDDLVVLHQGKVLAQGPMSRVIAEAGAQDVNTAFMRLTGAQIMPGGGA